jgi:two-component system sensor histidine kinase SenX3
VASWLVLALGVVLAVVAIVGFSIVGRERRKTAARAEALDEQVSGARTEKSIAEAERARVVASLLAVGDGVVIADAAGSVVFRNPIAERYHGARRSEAVAEDVLERLLARALAGDNVEHELSLFGPPRSTLIVRAVPLELGGARLGAAAFVRDVTELRRVEQVRRDFVANVSHELKTPIGALELLAETLSSCDDAEVQQRLAMQLVAEADRLGRIVDDLLDLSLIEAQETPDRQRVAVRVLVDEAVERVRGLALARSIPLRVAPVPDELVVECDATRVVGAVMNLLDNAVKYSDSGADVEIGAAAEGDRVVITVADRGIGIPSSELERIFERFYRVDKARSRATGGTGLGLAIVRHVAHSHGGDVTVESREGAGSVFRFSLPPAEPQRDPPKTYPTKSDPAETHPELLVEGSR